VRVEVVHYDHDPFRRRNMLSTKSCTHCAQSTDVR
jgi:hypothetical protein